MNTLRLLFGSAVGYAVLLVLIGGTLPSESTPTLALTGIPLIIMVVIITRDLRRKSTSPTVSKTKATTVSFQGSSVQLLSSQFKVAATASSSYYEDVVRSRLKELLTVKVALETGLENETVRRLLSEPKDAPRLLEDESLCRTLSGPIPQGGKARMKVIGEAIDLIGAWKG